MKIEVREYRTEDATAASEIWNQVVDDGVAFPQEEALTAEVGDAFFKSAMQVMRYAAISGANISEKNWYLTV